MFRKFRGKVDLEGTPSYDPATRTVALKGMDYALDGAGHNPFAGIADRVVHRALREQLAQHARWPLGPQLDLWRLQMSRALTRSLRAGATMAGNISSLEPAIGSIGEWAITVRVVAAGNAEVQLARQ